MNEILLTDTAREQLTEIENDHSRKHIEKAVKKALALMQHNLRHPSLNTHEFTSLKGPHGEKVFARPTPNIIPVRLSRILVLWAAKESNKRCGYNSASIGQNNYWLGKRGFYRINITKMCLILCACIAAGGGD